MKKLSALLLTAVVTLVSIQAIAGGNELAYTRLQELPTITAANVQPGADYDVVYDASTGKVYKKLAMDADAGLVTLGAAETLTASAHAGKTLCIGSAAGSATLPAATGSGIKLKFTVCALPPTSGYVVQVVSDDTIDGQLISTQDSGDTVVGWETASDSDTITFTSSTKMGASIGGWFELQDIAADQWSVRGQGVSTGTEATPFSAAVSP